MQKKKGRKIWNQCPNPFCPQGPNRGGGPKPKQNFGRPGWSFGFKIPHPPGGNPGCRARVESLENPAANKHRRVLVFSVLQYGSRIGPDDSGFEASTTERCAPLPPQGRKSPSEKRRPLPCAAASRPPSRFWSSLRDGRFESPSRKHRQAKGAFR